MLSEARRRNAIFFSLPLFWLLLQFSLFGCNLLNSFERKNTCVSRPGDQRLALIRSPRVSFPNPLLGSKHLGGHARAVLPQKKHEKKSKRFEFGVIFCEDGIPIGSDCAFCVWRRAMANLGRSAASDFPDSVGVGSSYPVQNEFVLKVYHEEETPDKLLGCVALKPHQNIGELRYIIRTKLGHRPAFQLFNARQNTLVGPKFSRSAVLDVFQFPQEDVALVRKKVKKIRYVDSNLQQIRPELFRLNANRSCMR